MSSMSCNNKCSDCICGEAMNLKEKVCYFCGEYKAVLVPGITVPWKCQDYDVCFARTEKMPGLPIKPVNLN